MNKNLNILMVTHHRRYRSFPRSHTIAKYLVQRGHSVSLIVTSNHRRFGIVESDWDGVHIVESPSLLFGGLRSGWSMWSLINRLIYLRRDKGKYDILHCFETRPSTIHPALAYLRRHDDLLLVTDWNDWWGRGGIIDEFRPAWYRPLFGRIETYYEEAFRARADGLTVIATALAERAMSMGIPEEKICYISGGSLPEQFPARSIEECREKVGFPLSTPILGYSTIDRHVEMDFMMQSLAVIARKYPDVKLLITGKPSKMVMEMAKKFGVEDNVNQTGFLPYEDLPWYLGCANLFVFPFPDKIYNVGRWPNKIGDYLSLGRPLVSHPVGDVKTLLEDYDIGRLAEWDPSDFAEKVVYLLENPDVAKQLGHNARELAVTKYDWKVLIEKLETFYYQLLDSR